MAYAAEEKNSMCEERSLTFTQSSQSCDVIGHMDSNDGVGYKEKLFLKLYTVRRYGLKVISW